MKKIYNLQIDTSYMPAEQSTRGFIVSGESGAEFILYALENGTLKYYNFVDKVFELGNSINTNLKITLTGSNYNNQIVFPSGGGTYTIKLLALPETEVQSSNKIAITKSMSKASSNAIVTFTAATANTSNYATFPTSTVTGALTYKETFNFDWDIVNASTDGGGFGLRLASTPVTVKEADWYFTTTDTVDGAISPTDANGGLKVVVDDLTDIGVGTIISGVSGGSLSGTPSIIAIDTVNKLLTLNVAQTFADGITLTFKAIGTTAIKNATGMLIKFALGTIVSAENITKTVRNDATGTTIDLNGTYGLTGGGHASMLGYNVDQAASEPVTVSSVSASEAAGSIVVSVSQVAIPQSTILEFIDVYQTINFLGTITIEQLPTTNKTIYLDVDNIITVGTAS